MEEGLLKCKFYNWITFGPLSGGSLTSTVVFITTWKFESDYITVQTWLLLPCIRSSMIRSTTPILIKRFLKALINRTSPFCYLCFRFLVFRSLHLLHDNNLQLVPPLFFLILFCMTFPLVHYIAFPLLSAFEYLPKCKRLMANSLGIANSEYSLCFSHLVVFH